jgi:hypothetical protein
MEEDGESEEEDENMEEGSSADDELLFEDGEGSVTKGRDGGEERMNGTTILRGDGRSL